MMQRCLLGIFIYPSIYASSRHTCYLSFYTSQHLYMHTIYRYIRTWFEYPSIYVSSRHACYLSIYTCYLSIYTCILSIDTYVLGLNIHLSISPRAMLAIFLCTHTIYRSIQYRSIHTYYLSIYTHILAFNIYLSTSHRATLTHIEQRGACLLHQSSAVALGVHLVHCIRFPSSSSSSSFSALAPE